MSPLPAADLLPTRQPATRLPGQRLPVRLVAGAHSGRNARLATALALPGEGRWLWLTAPLQRSLAQMALEAGGPGAGQRLLLDGLPGGCACCATAGQLAAGLARVVRQRRREGESLAGVLIQVEPDGDPARLADQLLSPACAEWLALESIVAVLSTAELAGLSVAADAPGIETTAGRNLRCLGPADMVWVAPPGVREAGAALAGDPIARATVLGRGWSGLLVPSLTAPGSGQDALLAEGWQAWRHEPFDGGRPWPVLARWPADQRFDRRAVAAWLERCERRLADCLANCLADPSADPNADSNAEPNAEPNAELNAVAATPPAGLGSSVSAGVDPPRRLAFIARTERDWLGWSARGDEVSLQWRHDSRLALVPPITWPATVGADAATLGAAALGGEPLPLLGAAPS